MQRGIVYGNHQIKRRDQRRLIVQLQQRVIILPVMNPDIRFLVDTVNIFSGVSILKIDKESIHRQ